mmetsp:Transcript_11611/g.17586  ORF Transcript_11611/g.17586 Transcript_11611/m.17586 type:complete len:204 (+) Transcript_11611:680-1291(+)
MLAAFDNYYHARQRQLDFAALVNFKSEEPVPTTFLASPGLVGSQTANERISHLVNRTSQGLDRTEFQTVLNIFGETSINPEGYTYAMLDREVSLAVYAFSLPLLFANMHGLASWINFSKLTVGVNFLFFFLGLIRRNSYPNFEWFDFGKRATLATATLAVLFFMYEKVKKELYVLITSNGRTKRQFMRIFDCANPMMIVNKEG